MEGDPKLRQLLARDGEAIGTERMLFIEDTLVQKAKGVFLWVTIVVKMIIEGTASADSWTTVEKILSMLPSKLKDVYQQMWNRYSLDREQYLQEALQLFQLLLRRGKKDLSLIYVWIARSDAVRKGQLASHMKVDPEWLLQSCKDAYAQILTSTAGFLEFSSSFHKDKEGSWPWP